MVPLNKALVVVKGTRSAESEKERTALAKCLAKVLPIHFGLLHDRRADHRRSCGPYSLPSAFRICAFCTVSCENPATREDLGVVALVQIFTYKGRPSQISDSVKAYVLTTRWVFERPHTFDSVLNGQPLHLISMAPAA